MMTRPDKPLLLNTNTNTLHDRRHQHEECNIDDISRMKRRYYQWQNFFSYNGELYLLRRGGYYVIVKLCQHCTVDEQYNWAGKPNWLNIK